MLSRKFFMSAIAVISMTSSVFAQLVPGPGSGGNQTPPNQPNPPRYDGRNDGNNGHSHQPPRYEQPRQQPPDYYYPPNQPNPPRYDGRNDGYYPPHYPPPRHDDTYYPRPDPRPDYPYYPPAPYPDYPPAPYPDYPDYGQTEIKSGWVGRTVRNERLPLKDLVDLNEYYRGWEIVSVRAQTRPNSSSTTIARLVVDGRIVASETNPGYDIALFPEQRILIGGRGQSISLDIVGSTYIENLEVEIRRGGSDYNPPIDDDVVEIPMYRQVYGDDQIDLAAHLDMYRLQGLRVQEVLITGRSSYGTGTIDLVVNGYNVGSAYLSQSGYSSTESIYAQRIVRIDPHGYLALRTRGNMTIENVTLILTRN